MPCTSNFASTEQLHYKSRPCDDRNMPCRCIEDSTGWGQTYYFPSASMVRVDHAVVCCLQSVANEPASSSTEQPKKKRARLDPTVESVSNCISLTEHCGLR